MPVFADQNVSRETITRLTLFHDALLRWNSKINLVSKATVADAWERHFQDSAQLFPYRPTSTGIWMDLGSGAGFPGLVLAILAAEAAPELRFVLVESDQRKAAFLRSVSRECDINIDVQALRIEGLAPQNADILSARALAPLVELLHFSERHGRATATSIFPKGAHNADEISRARASFRFDLEKIPSTTQPDASLLIIRNLSRVRPLTND